ncbi:MAG: class B sortase [Eubacteriaceae bacterium]|nr:class B sortase [Eubacteriaceae bacterium]
MANYNPSSVFRLKDANQAALLRISPPVPSKRLPRAKNKAKTDEYGLSTSAYSSQTGSYPRTASTMPLAFETDAKATYDNQTLPRQGAMFQTQAMQTQTPAYDTNTLPIRAGAYQTNSLPQQQPAIETKAEALSAPSGSINARFQSSIAATPEARKHAQPKNARTKSKAKSKAKLAPVLITLLFALTLLGGGVAAARLGLIPIQKSHQGDEEVEKRQIAELVKYEPVFASASSTSIPRIEYAAIKALNPDYVFSMVLTGAGLSDPVLQGNDNDYYLSHTFKKKSEFVGSIYMDYRNKSDLSDQNTVFYGHSMKNGTMFGWLRNYRIQAEYEKDPFVVLQTKDADYYYQIFAVCVVEAAYDYREPTYGSNFESFISRIKARSSIKTSVPVVHGDKIITLSTCTSSIDDGRLAVFAVLINPDGGEVDLSEYRKNI